MKEDKILFSKKYLLGEFAKWAVNQSPYYVPENLEEALRKLSDLLPTYKFNIGGHFMEMERKEFHSWLSSIINQIPEVINWNNPRDGSNPRFNFICAYDMPTPNSKSDSDFVDLDALIMNIGRGLIAEYKK